MRGLLEMIRKSLEDWNRGDLDAIVETLDDDIVFRPDEGWPECVIHGKAAVRSFLQNYLEAVGHHSVIEDLIGVGNVVVVRLRAHLSGDHSGIEGDQHYTQVTTVRKGKIVLVRVLLGSPGSSRSRRAVGIANYCFGRKR